MAAIIVQVPDDLAESRRSIAAAVISDAVARLTEAGLRRDQIAALLSSTARELDPSPLPAKDNPAGHNAGSPRSSSRSVIKSWDGLRIAEKHDEWSTLVRLKKKLQAYSTRDRIPDDEYHAAIVAAVELLSLAPPCYGYLTDGCRTAGVPLITKNRDEWRIEADESAIDNEHSFCFLEDTELAPSGLKARVAWLLNEACVREDAETITRIWSACDGLALELGDAVQTACADAATGAAALSREHEVLRAMEAGERIRASAVRLRLTNCGLSYLVLHEWPKRLAEQGLIRFVDDDEILERA